MTLSRDITQNEGVVRYLEQVCRHIRARDVHNDIRTELVGHLEELVDVMVVEEGLSEDQAIRRAIQQMGDPDQIGGQLHQVHKPKTEWGLIALIAVFIGIGLLAMYSVQLVIGEESFHIFNLTLLYVLIGSAVMITFYFLDYRKLQRFTWYLYGTTVLLLLLARLNGDMLMMSRMGNWLTLAPYSFDIMQYSLYMFTIAIAGMLFSGKRDLQGKMRKAMMLVRDVLVLFIVPGGLYLSVNAFLEFTLYCAVLIVLLVPAKKLKLIVMGCSTMSILLLLVLTFKHDYMRIIVARLSAFINPAAANRDNGYMITKSLEAIRSAGMWGKGIGAENPSLPYIHNDMIFTYLVYCFGWVAGIGIITVVLMLAGRLVGVVKRLHDPYAKGIVIGIFSIISIQYLWNIAMSVGLLPMTSMRLPFIGYGGTTTLIEMAAIGVILSVYRRKDMIPRQAASTQS